jgi:hypothetical protein
MHVDVRKRKDSLGRVQSGSRIVVVVCNDSANLSIGAGHQAKQQDHVGGWVSDHGIPPDLDNNQGV